MFNKDLQHKLAMHKKQNSVAGIAPKKILLHLLKNLHPVQLMGMGERT
jgi:hypothetical protein